MRVAFKYMAMSVAIGLGVLITFLTAQFGEESDAGWWVLWITWSLFLSVGNVLLIVWKRNATLVQRLVSPFNSVVALTIFCACAFGNVVAWWWVAETVEYRILSYVFGSLYGGIGGVILGSIVGLSWVSNRDKIPELVDRALRGIVLGTIVGLFFIFVVGAVNTVAIVNPFPLDGFGIQKGLSSSGFAGLLVALAASVEPDRAQSA